MKQKLFLFLAQYQLFWKIIQKWKQLTFKGNKIIHNLNEEYSEIKQEYDHFRIIQRWVFNPIILATIFAIMLQLSNYPLTEYKSYIRESFTEILLIRFNIAPSSDYVTYLAAISAVGSVFIGLYYAALMSIQSALYSRLPSNIRDLLSQEKLGNVYMKFLAFVTFLSFVLLAFRLIGFEKIYLVPFIMTILTGVSIFAFISLGKVAFHFFDPTKLSINVFWNLDKAIKNVMVNGIHFSDKNFQNYNYQIAFNACETLSLLTDYVLTQKHLNIKSSIGLNLQILELLEKYSYWKKLIDTQGLWYEQKYIHKSWYQLDNIQIYSQVGVGPEPEVIGDIFWLEKKLTPLIIKSVEKNFRHKNYTVVREILKASTRYCMILSIHHDISNALDIVNKIENALLINNVFPENEIDIGAIVDMVQMTKIQILLSFLETLKDENLLNDDRLENINWYDKKSIFTNDFDAYLLEELHDLQKRLNYEIQIENKIITPLWYQNELIKRVKTEKIVENLSLLLAKNIFKVPEKIDIFPLAKAAYLSRHWEYIQKIFFHFSTIKERWMKLQQSRKVDFNWKEIDLDALYKDLKEQRKLILTEMSLTNLKLSHIEPSQDHPDYFGHFNTIVEDEIIDLILNNDLETFKVILPTFFFNSLAAFERLRPTETSFNVFLENKFVGAFAPILDLLDICGYCKVISDFHSDQSLWNIVISVWDEYFQNSTEKIVFFTSGINLTESRFSLAPRDVIRTKWQQKVANFLEANIEVKEYFKAGNFNSHFIALHPSPLVRIFVRDQHYWISNDGIDVFILFYFKEKFTDTLDFGQKRKRRLDDDKLNREIQKYKKYIEDSK